ncbi:MAG: type II toxin-antitoxin system RelE/ParE family toxin [Clostridia bacterium]|nr:type II toxin-antitoxin system RelE/ParE family toxin [Clostridia bacterium]
MAERYRVLITVSAERDVAQAYEYIRRENPRAARRWLAGLREQILTLEQFPLRCAVVPEADELGYPYRHLLYGHYRLVFRVDGSTVTVLRVIHQARLLEFPVWEP